MKHSYPDSLITLASSLAMASSAHKNRYDIGMADNKASLSKFRKFNLKHSALGIKFDNISAGKYFALINKVQRHTVVRMETGSTG